MNSKKEFLKFVFMEDDPKPLQTLKSQILYQFQQLDQEKNKSKKKTQQIYSSNEIQYRRIKASQILEIMREFKIMPISV